MIKPLTIPQSLRSRPWYCPDHIVDEYKTSLSEGRDQLIMLKSLKVIRAIIVNVGLFAVGGYAISRGGDPTLLGITVLAVAGAYNGLELGDYLALVQAYQEIQTDSAGGDGDP